MMFKRRQGSDSTPTVLWHADNLLIFLQVQLFCATQVGSACPPQTGGEGGDFLSCDWVDWKETSRWVPGKEKKANSASCYVGFFLIFSLIFLPFQKVFVLPNMDDIYLPLMHSGVDRPQTGQRQSSQCPCSQSSSAESIQRIPAESDQCLADWRTKIQQTEKMKTLCLWEWSSFEFNVYK